MAIDDNTVYGLTGAQVKELPEKIEAVRGLAKVLTTDDYNYPTSSPSGIALWLLEPGVYEIASGTTWYYTYSSSSPEGCLVVKGGAAGESSTYIISQLQNSNRAVKVCYVNSQGSPFSIGDTWLLKASSIVDGLTSTSTNVPLSANQGRVLKGLIDSIAIRGAGAPTTSTVGQVGTLYEDTTNGVLYICTDATNPYVWEEVGGGAGVDAFTTNEWNALWA